MGKNSFNESGQPVNSRETYPKLADSSYALLKDRMGKRSLIRFALLIAIILGSVLITVAIVALFQNNPQATAFATTGAGLITFTAGAKAYQGRGGF